MKDLNKVVKLELAADMRLARLEQELDDAVFIFTEKHSQYLDAKHKVFELKEEIKRLKKWKDKSVL